VIGAVLLASDPPTPRSNGEQLELLSPSHLLESALKPFLLFSLNPIVIVLGHDYHHILNMFKDLPSPVKIVIHRKPELGLPSALSVGLQALSPEIGGIVIAKGEQIIEARILEHLLKTFEQEEKKTGRKKRIVIPLYRGKRGFPWVVSSDFRKSLTKGEGDLTLGTFLKNQKKDILTVSVS